MKEMIIKNYINSITLNDVKKFANNNNIYLNENEFNFIYNSIKKNWKILLYGNPDNIFNDLKNIVDYKSYLQIVDLYKIYKNKYQSFL